MGRGRRSAGTAGSAGLGKARSQSWDVLDAVQVVVLIASSDGWHDGGVGVDLQSDAVPLSLSQSVVFSPWAVAVTVNDVLGGGDEDEEGNKDDDGFHGEVSVWLDWCLTDDEVEDDLMIMLQRRLAFILETFNNWALDEFSAANQILENVASKSCYTDSTEFHIHRNAISHSSNFFITADFRRAVIGRFSKIAPSHNLAPMGAKDT